MKNAVLAPGARIKIGITILICQTTVKIYKVYLMMVFTQMQKDTNLYLKPYFLSSIAYR